MSAWQHTQRVFLGTALVLSLAFVTRTLLQRQPVAEHDGTLININLDAPALGLTVSHVNAAGVPVICYHYFRRRFDVAYTIKFLGTVILGLPVLGDREFWTTPATEFEKHLRYFRDTNTDVLTLDQVAARVAAGKPLPPRAVVLTIDDADESVYRIAWPLLRKYGMRAHLFVPTGHVGETWNSLRVCSWDQLREMSQSGYILIESHTRNLHYKLKSANGPEPAFLHPDLVSSELKAKTREHLAAQLTAAHTKPSGVGHVLDGYWGPIATDLLASRLDISTALQTTPRWLAWPYGFAHGELDSIARLVGFRGTVSLAPTAFTDADTNMASGRYTLTAHTTLDMIKDIIP